MKWSKTVAVVAVIGVLLPSSALGKHLRVLRPLARKASVNGEDSSSHFIKSRQLSSSRKKKKKKDTSLSDLSSDGAGDPKKPTGNSAGTNTNPSSSARGSAGNGGSGTGSTEHSNSIKVTDKDADDKRKRRSAKDEAFDKDLRDVRKATEVTVKRLEDPLNPEPDVGEEVLKELDKEALLKVSIHVARDYAKTAKKEIDDLGKKVARSLGGKLAATSSKSVESIESKLTQRVDSAKYKENVGALKDIARNTLIVKDQKALEEAKKQVRKLAEENYKKLPGKVRESIQAKAKIARDMDKLQKTAMAETEKLQKDAEEVEQKAKEMIEKSAGDAKKIKKIEENLEKKQKKIDAQKEKIADDLRMKLKPMEEDMKNTKKKVEDSWKEIEDLEKQLEKTDVDNKEELEKKLKDLKNKKEEILKKDADNKNDAIFVKNKDPDKYDGYSDTTFQIPVGVSDGGAVMYSEIQINTPQMMYVKMKPSSMERILGKDEYAKLDAAMKAAGLGDKGGRGHKIYDEVREGKGDLQKLKKESQDLYGKARDVDLSKVDLWNAVDDAEKDVSDKKQKVEDSKNKVAGIRNEVAETEAKKKKVDDALGVEQRRLEELSREKREKLWKLREKLILKKKQLEEELEEAEAELEEAVKELEEAEQILQQEETAATEGQTELGPTDTGLRRKKWAPRPKRTMDSKNAKQRLGELKDELEGLEGKTEDLYLEIEEVIRKKVKLQMEVDEALRTKIEVQVEMEELEGSLGM